MRLVVRKRRVVILELKCHALWNDQRGAKSTRKKSTIFTYAWLQIDGKPGAIEPKTVSVCHRR
jgi:hypothetical protein